MILNILSMEYSKEEKKLLKAIKDKEKENMESEKKTDLEEDVTRKVYRAEDPNVKETFRGTRKLWKKVGRRY